MPASAWCSRSPIRFPKSIYENVAYGPRIHGLAKSKTDLDEIVTTSLQRAGLWEEVKDRLDDTGTGLSGGQQQRLCIARAIAVSPEMILMDEPCSALDPIATAKIEELMDELRENFTIIIVTHSMQQAARVSQRTAFFHLGVLVEYGTDQQDVHDAERQAHPGLHHRPLRLSRRAGRVAAARMTAMAMNEHTAKAFDADLQELTRMVAEMGGLAEKQIADAVGALARRDAERAKRVIETDAKIDALQREIEEKAVLTIARRQPMAVDLREIVSALRIANDLERIGDLAKNIAKRVAARPATSIRTS